VVISISPGSDGLPSKEYYKKPIVVANYTRTVAEMMQVISSGQPWNESTTTSAAAMDTAKKIVELERKISTNSPDPEAFNDPLVSIEMRFVRRSL
jgi:hypothetical protein